jgi:hypothetical protein
MIEIMSVKCAECQCALQECTNVNDSQRCQNCTKEECCCIIIHHNFTAAINLSVMDDECCSQGVCKNNSNNVRADLNKK